MTNCPCCYSDRIIRIGEIPKMDTFAGNKLTVALPRNDLFKCKNCNLHFRWPYLNKEQLAKLYQEGNSESWQYTFKNKVDWQIAANLIKERFTEGSILDIGCWDGKFLEHLKENYNLYGMEINSDAAIKSSKKGINIIAKNIYDAQSLSFKFDVVTAFDVIEHMENPLIFLEFMSRLVKDNGTIIISSGNTETLTWKIQGSRYWYCQNPEHISFINKKWCFYAAKKLNLQIELIKKYASLGRFNLIKSISDVMQNIIYPITPSLLANFRKVKHTLFSKKSKILNKKYNYPPSRLWLETI